MGRARWAGCALLAFLLFPRLLAQSAPRTQTVVEVPGGIAAVARVVEQVDLEPDRFFAKVNDQLLTATRLDHDWREVPRRRNLTHFLDLVAEIERRFPGGIELGAGEDERRRVARLADLLGYELALDQRRAFSLLPKGEGDEEQAFRRSAAQALGLEVESWSARLDAGESLAVELPRDRVVVPIAADLWQRLTDQPLGSGALGTLARDQRTSLIIAGRERVSRETAVVLDGMDLRRIRDRAPFAFRRYAPAIAIENGRLMAPGGDAMLPEWHAMVRPSSDSDESLLLALLETHHAKGAYLWHALRFAPPPAVEYFTTRRGAEDKSLLRRVFDRLDGDSGGFDGAQARQPGFDALVRSIPFAVDPSGVLLPGGPRLWRKALDGDALPETHAQLRSLLENQSADPIDEEDLLLDLLADSVHFAPGTSKLRRLIRGIDFFARHPALSSPENVVLVARGSAAFAPALDTLDDLELRSPDAARDYLLAVSRLDRFDLDWSREQLVIAFQGGVEWLRAITVAGRVDADLLDRELLDWIAIHTRHADAASAAPDQLRWLARLLRALPPAPDDAPGRGPLERALLEATVAPTESQLTWMGLDYDSDRTRRLTAGMAETLDFFSIPEVDRLVRIDGTLSELAKSAREEDLEQAKTAAATLRDDLAALAALSPQTVDAGGDQPQRTGNPHRDEVAELAAQLLRRKRGKGLPGLETRIVEARRLLADDLRPVLAAPRYLLALGQGRGSLLQDRGLVRKHRLMCESPVQDRAWSEATVERGDDPSAGGWLCGHVGAIEDSLSSFTFSTARLRTGQGLDPRRSQAWFHHWSTTHWARMTPEATGAIAATMDAGFALLERGAREAALDRDDAEDRSDPLVELAASIVPRARLVRAGESPPRALVSPSEALMMGFAALERTRDVPALLGIDGELGPARAAIDAARARLGPDWSSRLAAVGPASPMANGKSGPTLGWWPSFEAIDLEETSQALVERELVDLHLLVVAYVGRRRLPGFVASDLMRRTMEDLSSTVELGHERDWESVLRRLRELDDVYFEARLRECLRLGFYRLREL